jgi:hypothetical protein
LLLFIFLDIPTPYTRDTYQQELDRFYISNCGLETNCFPGGDGREEFVAGGAGGVGSGTGDAGGVGSGDAGGVGSGTGGAGRRWPWGGSGYVVKNPNFMFRIPSLLREVAVDCILFPHREFVQSAISREQLSLRTPNGGLWNATDAESQIAFYRKCYVIFLCDVLRFRLPCLFLKFERFISSPEYLFSALRPLFAVKWPRITWEQFLLAYWQATDVQFRRPPRLHL